MAKLLKLRRGTTTQHGSFTGAEGEVTIDTTKDTAVVHDGSQAGGRPLAREDLNNVSGTTILGRLSNGSIVGTKLENSGVTAGSYGSATAIPAITVDAQGLITSASTNTVNTTTNLGTSTSTTSVTVTSSTGNNATIGEATGSAAGVMSTAHHNKLDGIESGATADQSASEILTAVKTVDGASSGLDADLLDGQHGSYYQNASNLNAGTIPDARFPSTLPAVSGANLTNLPIPSAFVSGMIIMWGGSTSSIPSGWVLCNGSNSTPDLRDRFIVGAGNSYSVSNTGGSSNTTLSTSHLPSHTHSFSGSNTHHHDSYVISRNEYRNNTWHPAGSRLDNPYSQNSDRRSISGGSVTGIQNRSISVSGTTGGAGSGSSFDNKPPYYALCFIQKT